MYKVNVKKYKMTNEGMKVAEEKNINLEKAEKLLTKNQFADLMWLGSVNTKHGYCMLIKVD